MALSGRRLAALREAPVMTRREVGLWLADEKDGRHYPRSACWCGSEHDGGEAGLTFTAPPWDDSRRREVAG